MGDTSYDDESVHQRLSSKCGECVEVGSQQAIGFLQGLHPNGDAECILQPLVWQAEADGKQTHGKLRYGCWYSFGNQVRFCFVS